MRLDRSHLETPYDDKLPNIMIINRSIQGNCWRWIGYINENGYGKMEYKGVTQYVHRVSAHIFHGLDLTEKGRFALHKNECLYADCFHPEHLYVGSHQDNMRDYREGRTHCPHGHDLTDPRNQMYNHGYYVECAECHRIRSRERYWNNKNVNTNSDK